MARHRMPDPTADECAVPRHSGVVPTPHGNGHSALTERPRHRRAEFTPSRFVTESTTVARYAESRSTLGHLASTKTPAHETPAHSAPAQEALGDADSAAVNTAAPRWDARVAGSEHRPHGNPDHADLGNASQHIGRGLHRRRIPKPGGRAIAASVAVGAFLSAAATSPNAGSEESVALSAASTDQPPAGALPPSPIASIPQVLQVPDLDVGRLAQQWTEQLAEGGARAAERAAREAEARRPLSVMPVSGTLTSNYGARWGTTHYGLDIANTIGTPIVSVTDGEVIEAGPAQGFGLWVRIRQDDGTIGVYGHIDQALVTAGQRVKAGELIATVGNRGQSTGPHLHYEVWQPDGAKSDPTAWLSARGVDIT